MTYLDPVEVAADHYGLLLDGERTRIVDMRLPVGARDNEHSDPTEFVYFIRGSTARIHLPDGNPVERDIPDGHAMEHEPGPTQSRTSATTTSTPSSSSSRT